MELENRIVPSTINVNPSNYPSLVPTARAGDTVVFAAGNYASGLNLSGMNGAAGAPITFTGPTSGSPAVIQGTSGANTVELDSTSYLNFENFTVDSQDFNDAIKAGGAVTNVSHDILIKGNTIINAENPTDPQQTVGISTKCIAWNWTIVDNHIHNCGTGLYLGNSDGTAPFINGIIENNLVENPIGYDMEIKDQIPYNSVSGMPAGPNTTIVRNNVFIKNDQPSPDGDRPNVYIGGFPASGQGSSDTYQIYGNLFDHNPRESLLQATGRASIHDNIFVDDTGIAAIALQPHSVRPPHGKTVTFNIQHINVYNNTIYSVPTGISVSGATLAQVPIVGNLVFATTPFSGITPNAGDNLTDSVANASLYVNNPSTVLGQMNFYPKSGQCQGSALNLSQFASDVNYHVDFNGIDKGTGTFRGAYAGSGTNPGWQLQDGIKPLAPAAPTNVSAVPGTRQVSLSWTASVNATSYNIYRATVSGQEVLWMSGVTGTSFLDTGLMSGTTYYYEVTAVNASGESNRSNEVSATAM